LGTLIKSGASATAPPPTPRDYTAEANAVRTVIRNMFPPEALPATADSPSGPFGLTVDFVSSLLGDLIHDGKFSDSEAWNKCAGTYLDPWLRGTDETGASLAEKLRLHFLEIDLVRPVETMGFTFALTTEQAKRVKPADIDESEGELLCDTVFSLAYGALLLLSHTKLRLIRGRRYGILGANGSGKSTLMRQLRDGKVENFPPQDQLRCVMVEHALQGEDTSLSILDFIAAGRWVRCTDSWSVPLILCPQTRLWPTSRDRKFGTSCSRLDSTMPVRAKQWVGSLVGGR
jgi:elongation factor 3